MLTEVRLPRAMRRAAIMDFVRRHGDYRIEATTVGVRGDGGECAEARIVISGMDEVPVRNEEAKAVLVGSDLD